MSIFEDSRSVWPARMLSVLRIVAALVFIEHGTQKLFLWPPSQAAKGAVALMSQAGVAGVIETFGGAALLLGLFTRPVAFLAAGEMAVAYFQAHFPRSFFPIQNGGDNAVLFCFIWLLMMVAGAGPWSIDHLISNSKRSDERTSVGARRDDLENRRRHAV